MRDIERRLGRLEDMEARRRPTPAPDVDPAAMAAFTTLMSTHPDDWPPGLFAATGELLAALPVARRAGR